MKCIINKTTSKIIRVKNEIAEYYVEVGTHDYINKEAYKRQQHLITITNKHS